MKTFSRIVAAGAVLGVAGCSSLPEASLGGTFLTEGFINRTIVGEGFQTALAREYQLLAQDAAQNDVNWYDASAYYRRGVAALAGEAVSPWDPAALGLGGEATDVYTTVVGAVNGNRASNPIACARAQALYDHWLEELSEGSHACTDPNAIRAQLDEALAACGQAAPVASCAEGYTAVPGQGPLSCAREVVKEVVREVPGPERVVVREVPGPERVVVREVPGPVQYVDRPAAPAACPAGTTAQNTANGAQYCERTVTVAGPERTVTVPGPVQYVDRPAAPAACPAGTTAQTTANGAQYCERTVTVAGPERVVTVPGPERVVTVPGPERVVTVPGPVQYIDRVVQAPAAPINTCQQPSSYAVYFGFNRADLTAEATAVIREVAGAVGAYCDPAVSISGHADSSGNKAYNQRLAERRAAAVANALASQGIDGGRMTVSASGELAPDVNRGDGVREARNRRVTVGVTER